MTAPSHEAVLASVLETRGGRACFSVEQLAVASALSHLLCTLADGDVVGASNVATLTGLLPPRQEKPGKAWDLSRLSDRQVRLLERLQAVATGDAVPMVERRPKSDRHWAVVDLARLLDAAEARDGKLTETEMTQVRGAIFELVWPMCLPQRIWEAYLRLPDSIVAPEPEPARAQAHADGG